MPSYGMPGVAIDKKQSTRTALALLLVLALVIVGWRVYSGTRDEEGMRLALHTEQIGDGIVAGTLVRADGVLVGEVTEVAPAEAGTQRISLLLDPDLLEGLDDSLRVDYATGNLFGISEIALRPGSGGAPLRSGKVIDMTGGQADRAYDATMGSLLRSLSQVSGEVLTPQLASVLAQLAGDIRAYTPLLQSMVVLSRTVADVQTLPMSLQLGQYGRALDGGGVFIGAVLQVIDQVYRIQTLREDRPDIDATITAVIEDIFPSLENAMYSADAGFGGYTALLAPILNAAAGTVSDPQRSSAELRALIDRLRAAMPDTPDGPVLNVDVDLNGFPVLAPVLGGGVR
ncbi:MlaD family protein [Nocardia puris]|nr:MlaD family protein [Nocardia puris]